MLTNDEIVELLWPDLMEWRESAQADDQERHKKARLHLYLTVDQALYAQGDLGE